MGGSRRRGLSRRAWRCQVGWMRLYCWAWCSRVPWSSQTREEGREQELRRSSSLGAVSASNQRRRRRRTMFTVGTKRPAEGALSRPTAQPSAANFFSQARRSRPSVASQGPTNYPRIWSSFIENVCEDEDCEYPACPGEVGADGA